MSSTSFSLPHFDSSSSLSMPLFHTTDLIPAVLLFYGLAVAFLGFRLSRLFCFTLGLVVGAYYVDNLFESQSNVRHLALPLVVITLVSLVSAVTALLLHVVTLSALLGYVMALLVLAVDNGRVFGWGIGRWIAVIALQAAVLIAGRKNWTMLVVAATAVLGSLVTVLAIDHFADHTLSALLFTATYFRFLIGAQQAAPECGVDCWLLLLVWMVMSVVSFYVQLLLIQLQQTRLTKERQSVADDAVFSSTAFTYDTFSTTTAAKHATLPQSTPLVPLVSSASSSSFALPTKATFNFFNPERLPENLQPLYPVIQSAFDSVSVQYGFQQGNVANQGEHLLFLLGNVKSRGVNDAISRLHAKVFGNYVEWTTFLSLTAYCSSTAAYAGIGSGPSPSHGTYSYRASSSLKLQEIALWLCIWGEAGSLRHTPETLCYIYHNMGAELHVHRDDDGKQRVGLTAPVRRQGQFLTDVVQPIFEVLRAEKGDAETKFRNYDDWNEFFWSTHCLHFYFASPKYYVPLSDDGGESGTSQSTRLLPESTLPPSVSEGLKACSKTHLERRSWLHPARSFMRLISFYFTVFHILVCIAYCRFRGWPLLGPDANRAISSFVVSLAGWSVVKELIEIWAQYGIITQSVTNAAGFIMRLGIKTVAFGYLFAFYQWSIDWSLDYYDAYFITACIYLLPYLFMLLAQIFPVLALSLATAPTPTTSSASQWYRRVVLAITHFWYPTTRLYVGHDVNESKQQTYTYQLFWLLLLSWKFYCSYMFQVTPLIDPTFQILTAKPKWTHIWHYNEIAETLSIFILWIPFVLVYTFDTVIWYFMFQAVVGVLVGMSDRLGEIREFSALISAFTSLPWEFERKLLAWRAKEPHSIEPTPHHGEQQSSYGIIGSEGSEERAGSVSSVGLDMSGSVDDDDSHPSSDESRMLAEEYDLPVLVDQFRSTAWQNFAVAWNEVVEDLRHDDLLSNAEKQQLVFRMVPGSRKELYIPILLTAGCYENAVEKVGDVAHSYNESQNDANKQACTERLMAYVNHPIRREGIMELWESTQWLLSSLLGDRHEKDLAAIYTAFESIVAQGQLLPVVNADNLTKLKPALLNFVRAMRIAAASFTTFLESEKKKREAREGEKRERIRDMAEHERGMVSESDSEDEKDSPSSHPSSLHPLHTSKADKLSLKSILKSPSVGTLNILDTIRSHPRYQHSAVVVDDDEEENGRQYVILHLNLVRDQLQQFLNTLQSLVKPSTPESKIIGDKCKTILHDHHGFAWDDAYAGKCVHSVLKGSRISSILTTLHAHLTVAQIDAEPSNSEATRRLLFFANSLFMHIPSAPSIASMKSFSTLTPFHSEDVLYSFADLEKQTEDGVSVFFYLQTIYPNEWANFLQRVGIPDNRVASILHSRKTMEARMWATNRGQTLGRTIDGMMLYEKALRLLAKLEQPTLYDVDIDELVKQKFQYVVSAQVYGKQKRESDPKAAEIDIYLRKYPNMRVAYIDTLKVPRHDANGKHIVVEEHYSVLIKSENGEIKEVYRVQLPGNPILGEGKPENQNQAIIFTRGEYDHTLTLSAAYLQTIDMNQSNGFEEALKMRNLLEEFNPRPGQKAVGIVGFREHIYTGGLSSIAQYMALQEGCFVSQGQRVLDRPLRVRFHYGHPDVFDKLFFMGRGGVSKATKGINLSEDIFAGFNAILRGSSVVFREYIQVGKGRDVGLQQLYKFEAKLAQGNAMQTLSRDVYRLGQSLDFFRLLSFYFSGVGFYLSNSLTIWALYFFLYSRLLLSAFGVQKQDQFSGVETISYWFGMAGFLLTIPVFTTLGLERGFLNSAYETARMLLTGGPLFFMFHMGTKAYYFEQTILAGGAKYRPTGRGFVTRHEDFSEIYRFHASSHFYRAMEMVFLLTFYAVVIPWGFSYGLVTWAGWLIVVSWLLAPIWFNPLAFQWEKMVEDVGNFVDWMNRKEGDGDRSWKAWWKDEIFYLNDLNLERRIIVSIIGCRHAVVGYALLHYVHAAKMQLLVGSVVILCGLAVLAVAHAKFGHRHQYNVRALKAFIFFSVLVSLYYYYSLYHFTLPSLFHSGIVLIGLGYFLATFTTVLLTMGVRHRYLIRYYKLVDYITASFLLSVIAVFSVTVVPSIIQTRLMFHNAFSRGVMIDKLLKLQEESGKDTTPNTDPSGSVPKAGYQADGADPTKPQFDFASIGFIERRTKSRLRLHADEDEKERGGSRRGGKDESRHSNNGYTAEKEQAKKGREESTTGGKILSTSGLGGQSGRIPSYSSLSKLAEADDEEATPKTAPTQPSVQTSSGFSRGGAAPMSIHTTTGTLSPLPVGSPSPQSGQPLHSPLGANAPIPPTVATPPAGMAIPKTVSAQEYQSKVPQTQQGATQQTGKPGRLSVKGMAAVIDERSGKDPSTQAKK